MLKIKNLPQMSIDDELYHSVYGAIRDSNLISNISEDEKEMLDLIRNKFFRKVTVHLKDGNMFQVGTEEELSDELHCKNNQELLKILDSNCFQSITIQKQDNKIVRLEKYLER